MPKVKLTDDFYPGLSIYSRLRQTPESVLNRYSDLLEAKKFTKTDANLRLLLYTSKQLYVFIAKEGQKELNQYELEVKKAGKPVRGAFFPPFELVFELLSELLDYIQRHPRETLETAADFVVLADYLERKLGTPTGGIMRKISQSSSKLRKQLLGLSKIKRSAKRKKRKHKMRKSSRKSTPNYIR